MTVTFGDFELDPATFELRRGGLPVRLEPQAFDVLSYLVRHPNRVVSKEELMDQVWGGRFVTESAVTSRVKQVRQALGDDGRNQRVITTVHGRGYRFIAPLATTALNVEPGPTELLSPRTGLSLSAPSPNHLVGRAAELTAVDRLVSQARAGRGGTVVVSGEPGIGKTALLAALSARVAAGGGRVLSGRGVASGRPFRPLAEALLEPWRLGHVRDAEPLRPFRRALDRVLPDWLPDGGVLGTDDGADPVLLIAEGLAQILCGLDAEFGVLIVDDAQDADPDTVAVVEQLATRANSRPLLVVLARSDWPRSVGLDRIASAAGTVRMPLGRLDGADVRSLITSGRELSPELVAAVVDRSEGLPVVAVELAAAITGSEGLDWAVPEGFAALVEARLFTLSDDDRRLLAAAAVLGRDPDWDLVPKIVQLDDLLAADGFHRAVRLHLLTGGGGRLGWRHDLIRQVVWATLLPPERRAMTRAAVAVLMDRGGPHAAAQAAELMMIVGDADGAVTVWLGLARVALATGGLHTASGLLDRAAATGLRRAAVAIERVGLMSVMGRPIEGLELGLPVLADAFGDEHAELCLRLAFAAGASGRWTESQHLVERAGRSADPRSAVLLSDAAHALGAVEEAVQYAEVGVAWARTEGRADVLCDALGAQARAERLRNPAAARLLFAEAAQLASEYGFVPRRVDALLGLATIELLDAEDSPRLAEAHQVALDAGLLGRAAQTDLLLAEHALLTDGPSGSAEAATRVGDFGRLARLGYLSFAGDILLATRSALAGDNRATEFRLSCLEAGPELPLDMRFQLHGVRAQAALVRHDLDAAADQLDAAVRPLIDYPAAAPFALFGVWALITTLVRTDVADVSTLLAQHTAGRRRVNRGALCYADAVSSGRAGDQLAAADALTAGDQLLAPTPWWRRFLHTYVLEAAVAEGWADAVPRLRVDLAAFEAAGEDAMARLVRDLLRRAGAPTRRGRGDAVVPIRLRAVGVTSREMDVLRLVCEGVSNADIGVRLFLSPRTVETHVTSLLAKSGARNRRELTVWAAIDNPAGARTGRA